MKCKARIQWDVIVKMMIYERPGLVVRKAYFKRLWNATLYKTNLIQKYCMDKDTSIFNQWFVNMETENRITYITIYIYKDPIYGPD